METTGPNSAGADTGKESLNEFGNEIVNNMMNDMVPGFGIANRKRAKGQSSSPSPVARIVNWVYN